MGKTLALIGLLLGLPSVAGLEPSALGQGKRNLPAPSVKLPKGALLTSPCSFFGELEGHDGLIVVPENRNVTDSRMIGVHFLRFPARDPKGLSPVFIVPGGPGQAYSEQSINDLRSSSGKFTLFSELTEYSRHRDVVIVNQRGNPAAPGLQSGNTIIYGPRGDYLKPLSIETASKQWRSATKRAVAIWTARGMDLVGYDILHLVDDVEALRREFGYKHICLRGGSFGSQAALAYIRRYPQNVERAILTGVEPLDHGYDSPDGIWAALSRVEQAAIAAGAIDVPSGGLMEAVKEIVLRLESSPVTVIAQHPRRGFRRKVVIGAEDFRTYLYKTQAADSWRDSLAYWPQFILDIHGGDYRFLAAHVLDNRPDLQSEYLPGKLLDSSLGISPEREKKLNREPARRWLGDINWRYVATRDESPAPVVDDDFRKFTQIDIPILLIQGDMDLNTPWENATELLKHLSNGHLIRVKGGTHAAAHEMSWVDPNFPKQMYRFMAADPAAVAELVATMPDTVELPPIKFRTDKPLFEALIDK